MPTKKTAQPTAIARQIDLSRAVPVKAMHVNVFAIERLGDVLVMHFALADAQGLLRSRIHLTMDITDAQRAWTSAKTYIESLGEAFALSGEWQKPVDLIRRFDVDEIAAASILNLARVGPRAELLFWPLSMWTMLKLQEAGDTASPLPTGPLTLLVCPFAMQCSFLNEFGRFSSPQEAP